MVDKNFAANKVADEDFVTVAKVLGPYGIKGWLKLKSFTQPEANVFDYQPWRLVYETGQVAGVVLAKHKLHGKGWVIAVEGCCDRNQAEAFGKPEIQVPRACFPEPEGDGFYWQDLIGCSVKEAQRGLLGTLENFVETGGHDVMSICLAETGRSAEAQNGSKGNIGNKGKKTQRYLIPFVQGVYVKEVDLASRAIHVDWPWLE